MTVRVPRHHDADATNVAWAHGAASSGDRPDRARDRRHREVRRQARLRDRHQGPPDGQSRHRDHPDDQRNRHRDHPDEDRQDRCAGHRSRDALHQDRQDPRYGGRQGHGCQAHPLGRDELRDDRRQEAAGSDGRSGTMADRLRGAAESVDLRATPVGLVAGQRVAAARDLAAGLVRHLLGPRARSGGPGAGQGDAAPSWPVAPDRELPGYGRWR